MVLDLERSIFRRNSDMTAQRALKLLGLLVFASWISAIWICFTIFGTSPLTSAARYLTGEALHITTFRDDNIILKEHPIKKLVRKAEIEFEQQLARQSKTLEAAASEYRSRYHRDPPSGFEMWYDFAVRHESMIIDDFDIINETLSTFWSLSGADVMRRVSDVLKDDWAIQHCAIMGGQLTGTCDHLGEHVLYWLSDGDHSPDLPVVDLLVNVLDEPRVLYDSTGEQVDQLEWTDNSQSPVWDKVTAGCGFGLDSGGKRTTEAHRETQNAALSFFDGKTSALNLCEHPEYSRMHGLWDAPSNLKTTGLTVPILSPAVPLTMGDIPVPAAAYSSSMYTFDEIEDIAWESKIPGLYWAGKTTGSIQSVTSDWRQHHRQRFVKLANEISIQPHLYLENLDHGTAWQQHNSTVMDGPLYTVYFTEIVQCADEATNEAISSEYDVHEPDERAESFKYTLNFDLDGNGHSGRFLRLLNSRSLPLKQTVFREWHDERLQPWLHYVPISLGMEELPEVVRYLSVEDEGQQLAALLAANGREWSLQALRPVDQAIYLYRLMLELARLQDPDRLPS